jgi:pyridoxamine 5'-phosphate oxidase
MNRFRDLDHFHRQSWDLLFRAAESRNDPMRTPMMATYDGAQSRLRTIVLRQVDKAARQLLFFTDTRSPKVRHLEAHPQVAITFWHPNRKVQLRIQGAVTLQQGGEAARRFWDHLSIRGRESYATLQAPGTPAEADTTGLPAEWSDITDKSASDFAFTNFLLIYVTVSEVDALHLHREGHQRGRFVWENDDWNMSWLVP